MPKFKDVKINQREKGFYSVPVIRGASKEELVLANIKFQVNKVRETGLQGVPPVTIACVLQHYVGSIDGVEAETLYLLNGLVDKMASDPVLKELEGERDE